MDEAERRRRFAAQLQRIKDESPYPLLETGEIAQLHTMGASEPDVVHERRSVSEIRVDFAAIQGGGPVRIPPPPPRSNAIDASDPQLHPGA